ncbi:MAG TPA: hypothetical protein VK971_08440 [Thiohalobacter sp.]|nr:hypothetical protein [Thiohalobacter sp.]
MTELFRELDEADRHALIRYAEFLVGQPGSRSALPAASEPAEPVPPEPPRPIPRPESESVIKAVKRLSETYYMLNKNELLNATSPLVTEHVMHGRPAAEVIDRLEAVFEEHYQAYLEQRS